MTELTFVDFALASVLGCALYDMGAYLFGRAWSATRRSIAEDAEWRVGNGAPLYDLAGNRVEEVPPHLETEEQKEERRRKGLAWLDSVRASPSLPRRPDADVKTIHGITTASSGREDVATVMTEVGTLTVSLVRGAPWVNTVGVADEVAGVLRVVCDEARRQLVVCDGCASVGGLHTVDCIEVEELVDMATTEMTSGQGDGGDKDDEDKDETTGRDSDEEEAANA